MTSNTQQFRRPLQPGPPAPTPTMGILQARVPPPHLLNPRLQRSPKTSSHPPPWHPKAIPTSRSNTQSNYLTQWPQTPKPQSRTRRSPSVVVLPTQPQVRVQQSAHTRQAYQQSTCTQCPSPARHLHPLHRKPPSSSSHPSPPSKRTLSPRKKKLGWPSQESAQ